MAKPIPDGYYTVTPSVMLKDSKKAIEFYKKAFGAKVLDFFPNPMGQGIMHATIQIGTSILMMGDEMTGGERCGKSAETLGSSPISLYMYVPNVDETFKRAVAAGGTETMRGIVLYAGSEFAPFGSELYALPINVLWS